MRTYDMRCADGHLFEIAAPESPANAACPVCGAASVRHWSASFGVGGNASAGPAREEMPRSWQAVRNGDPSVVRAWHRAATARERLEEKHPEIAGDRRPVLAHEGRFAQEPLRAGDPLPAALARPFGSERAPVNARPHDLPSDSRKPRNNNR